LPRANINRRITPLICAVADLRMAGSPPSSGKTRVTNAVDRFQGTSECLGDPQEIGSGVEAFAELQYDPSVRPQQKQL
jgi:hypothetical protein